MRLAYLAERQIHLLDDGAKEPRELTSTFVDDVRRRSASIDRKSAWKSKGTGARFMGAAAMWDESEGRIDPIWFTCLARGRQAGELLYSVWTGSVSAILAQDVSTGEETRLSHGTDAPVHGIASSDDHRVLALVRHQKDGSQNLAVMRDDGGEAQLVTDGDTIDESPAWVPVAPDVSEKRHQLVFSTRGIGRDAAGRVAGFAPTEIALLDAEHGDLKTVVQHPEHDYLEPRMLPDGTLYMMRRPYREGPEAPSATHVLKDGILAPFRLAYAGFRYLDFFSQKYSGKPLTTSGDTKGRNVDARRLVERQNVARAGQDGDEEASRAPSEWLLVRRRPGGQDETIAHSVAAYDVTRSGVVHVTDGRVIGRIDPNGASTKLTNARFATSLVPV